MTRSPYVAEGRSVALALAEARAAAKASEIESLRSLFEADAKAVAAENRIRQVVAEVAKSQTRVIPQPPIRVPVVGRSVPEIATWRKVFDYVDELGAGNVSKHIIQARLAPEIGAFDWEDDHDETPLTFQQFVDLMTSSSVPVEKRFEALSWGRTKCPDKVYPADGGKPFFTREYFVQEAQVPTRVSSVGYGYRW
eukprot:EG_transcript_18668